MRKSIAFGLLVITCVVPQAISSEAADLADLKADFLTFCDTNAKIVEKQIALPIPPPQPTRRAFFPDAYAVRALGVAFDVTGDEKYLQTCKRWADRIIRDQKGMIPKGAYYINGGRQPGEDNGIWYVADSSSIALGVLATAVRCDDPNEKAKYLDSVKSFFRLVADNWVRPSGGVANGHWPKSDDEFWCATGIFGSLAFCLYKETGDEECLKVGRGTIDWLNKQDMFTVASDFYHQEIIQPMVMMYCLEAYSAGLPHLDPRSERHKAALAQLAKIHGWILENMRLSPSDKYVTHRGTKRGGLPFHLYVFAGQVPGNDTLVVAADRELAHIGKIIKSAVSRQREFLADAAAVQFTRNPDGLAGALKKLGGRRNTSKIINAHAFEMSHLFFGNAFGRTSGWIFSTHPPLVDRIRRIDPSFDGNFPKVQPIKHHWQDATSGQAPSSKTPVRGGDPFAPIAAVLPIVGGPATAGASIPLEGAAGVLPAAGMAGGVRLAYIAALLDSIPRPLREASRESFGARAVILATLIDRDPEVRAKQFQMLQSMGDLNCTQEVQLLVKSADQMDESSRLPLVETALPNLKSLSPEQYDKFRKTLVDLIKADGRVDLFEFAVQTLVIRHLDIHFGKKSAASIQHHHSTIRSILPEAVRLFSTLAYVGSQKSGDGPIAFEKGMEKLGASAVILPKESCSLRLLGETLEKLNDTVPLLKHQIVDACVAIILADQEVTPKEYELLQVIGAILEVPLPPLEK